MKHCSGVRRVGLASLLVACVAAGGCGRPSGDDTDRIKMGMMPKLIGIPYFTACERGAQEAADELGIDLDYDGPAVDNVEEQAKIVDRWIAQGYDIIAIAPNDPEVIAPALRRAVNAGIVVVTWDADANAGASGRAAFVNQASTDGIAKALVDVLAEAMGGEGSAVIITGSATSPNQNAWMEVMRDHLADEYPEIDVPEALVSDEDQSKAQQMARDAMAANPDLDGIWGITSVALPGAAKAVRDAGRVGEVHVTGLSLPNTMREYVKDGTVERFVLWNAVDLGYLTVHVANQLREGALEPQRTEYGRLAEVTTEEDEVILGPPLVFSAENIDDFDF